VPAAGQDLVAGDEEGHALTAPARPFLRQQAGARGQELPGQVDGFGLVGDIDGDEAAGPTARSRTRWA